MNLNNQNKNYYLHCSFCKCLKISLRDCFLHYLHSLRNTKLRSKLVKSPKCVNVLVYVKWLQNHHSGTKLAFVRLKWHIRPPSWDPRWIGAFKRILFSNCCTPLIGKANVTQMFAIPQLLRENLSGRTLSKSLVSTLLFIPSVLLVPFLCSLT